MINGGLMTADEELRFAECSAGVEWPPIATEHQDAGTH
jgi:hypothetical protein